MIAEDEPKPTIMTAEDIVNARRFRRPVQDEHSNNILVNIKSSSRVKKVTYYKISK